MARALHGQEIRTRWLAASVAAFVVSTWPVTDSLAVHMLQHIALISVIPPFVLRGAPGLTAGAAFSVERGVALVIGGVLLVYAAHVPAVFEADLGGTLASAGLHLLLLGAGLLIALPVTGQRCAAGLTAVALVALAELGVGALGMLLAWIPDLVYRLPEGEVPKFGLSPGTDQSLAGAFILVLAEPLLAAEFIALFFRALDDDEDEDEPI